MEFKEDKTYLSDDEDDEDELGLEIESKKRRRTLEVVERDADRLAW